LLCHLQITENNYSKVLFSQHYIKLTSFHTVLIFNISTAYVHGLAFCNVNSICHLSAQSQSLFRSCCNCSPSAELVTFLNILVSSANLSIMLMMSTSKSLIKIRNSSGPRTDPCGMPLNVSAHFELNPSKQTLCFLPLRPISQHDHLFHEPAAWLIDTCGELCQRPLQSRGISHPCFPSDC